MFFFCKQKPAYEMRISDWSSDVCSSDLSARALAANPAIILFGSHAAGFLILAALADSAVRADDGIARLSTAELARRFAVSRAHVRHTLAAARARGLLKFVAAEDRGIVLAPQLWSAIDLFIAESEERHDHTAMIAVRETDARGAGTGG